MIPTSNHNQEHLCKLLEVLYIFWFLHQTTTAPSLFYNFSSCISFDSYIKPQLTLSLGKIIKVVYLLIPTSNHNLLKILPKRLKVVYLLIPTSNHNPITFMLRLESLYIFWFLHQTTTCKETFSLSIGCISFDSYIKPQPS